MMYGVLFALLGLCLACFREGVWTKYTARDVARWQADAAQTAPVPPPVHLPRTALLPQPGQVSPNTGRPAPRPEVEAYELVA